MDRKPEIGKYAGKAADAAAKKARNFARADEIRAELTEKGFVVEDTPKGPKVSRAK